MAERATAPTRSSALRWVVTLLLAAGMLWLALRNVSWEETLRTLKGASPPLLALACLVMLASSLLRGLRWWLLLIADGPITWLKTYLVMMVGYLGNSFLPARAGEVIRIALIGRVSAVSSSYALATALFERLMDGLLLVVLALISLQTVPGLPEWLRNGAQVTGTLGVVGLAGMLALPRLSVWLRPRLERLLHGRKFAERALGIFDRFVEGMRALAQPKRALLFIVLMLITWSSDALMAMIIASALGLSLTFVQALLLLSALGLSSAAPSTPGYVGIYQIVAVSVMAVFGHTESEAIAYILVFQAVNYLIVTGAGLLGLFVLRDKRSATS